MTHWKKSMVFSGSRIHQPVEAVIVLLGAVIQNTLARCKTSDQSFRQERPVVSRTCEYELARALWRRFHAISILFLTTAVHCLNQRSAFSNKRAFQNTPASSFRLIPEKWLFLLPRQEQAQGTHSPTPSWPHLTACALAAPAEKVRGLEVTYHQHEGWWPTKVVGDNPLPTGQGRGRRATTAHTAAVLQENCTELRLNDGCSCPQAKLATLSGAASCI